MSRIIFQGWTDPKQVNRTADIRSLDFLYMISPFTAYEIAIDCFVQVETPDGYRHANIDATEINSYSLIWLPSWVGDSPYPCYLALTPSTTDFLIIKGELTGNSFYGIPVTPSIETRNFYINGNEVTLISDVRFTRKELRIVNYSNCLIWIGYAVNILPGNGYPLASGQCYTGIDRYSGAIYAISESSCNIYVEEMF